MRVPEFFGTKYAYLLFSVFMAYIAQRGMARGYRDSMITFALALVPSELSHKFIGLNLLVLWQVYYKWYKSRNHALSSNANRPILDTWVGALGATIQGYALFKLAAVYYKNISAKHIIRECLKADSDIQIEDINRIGNLTWQQWIGVLLPLPQPMALALSHPDITKVKTLTYAHVGRIKTHPLYMDVYQQGRIRDKAPILVYIHGGGWIIGTRKYPPLPLIYHVASMGWVICSIDYRLAPKVEFPEQLIDCKRAIAYLRTHAEKELNADPHFIVIAGESAGAHLASLVALTPTDKSLQPGFEEVDTSVRACIDTYGVHDVLDRHGIYSTADLHNGFLRYIEFFVVQRRYNEENAEIFHKASPVSWLTQDHLHTSRKNQVIPPFMICHGSHDSLVLVDDSILFYERLQRYRTRTQRHVGGVKDLFIELPGAHHSFNFLLSPRAIAHAEAVCLFLDHVYKKTKHLPIGTSEGIESDDGRESGTGVVAINSIQESSRL